MTDVMSRVHDHLDESLQRFDESRIVGIFLQGSQNYGLETPKSDVDTKLIVTPTFDEVVLNKKPISTTHVRANNEHTDLKDIRLMLATFRKQNLNFIEILFTPYAWVNPLFESEWGRLTAAREQIAHYSPYSAVKTMKGIAMEKYHAMEHEYPSKLEVLAEYGYDPKQLHHILRLEEFMTRWLDGEPYEDCLLSKKTDYLKQIKFGCLSKDEAVEMADRYVSAMKSVKAKYMEEHEPSVNRAVDYILNQKEHHKTKSFQEEFLLFLKNYEIEFDEKYIWD